MIVEKNVSFTYGVLEQVLLELGFDASYGTNEFGLPYVIYENQEYDAIFSLPARPKSEQMYGGHFIVAEKAVEGRGVADHETFFQMLQETARGKTQIA